MTACRIAVAPRPASEIHSVRMPWADASMARSTLA